MRGPPETILSDKQQVDIDEINERHEDYVRASVPSMHIETIENPMNSQCLLEDYGWMINEEEHDKQILEELEEEEYVEECFNDMWSEEEKAWITFDSSSPRSLDYSGGDVFPGSNFVEGVHQPPSRPYQIDSEPDSKGSAPRYEDNARSSQPFLNTETDRGHVGSQDLMEMYGWMINEQEYDEQILEELEEEEYLEKCFSDMWLEEEKAWITFDSSSPRSLYHSDGSVSGGVHQQPWRQLQNASPLDADDDISRSES